MLHVIAITKHIEVLLLAGDAATAAGAEADRNLGILIEILETSQHTKRILSRARDAHHGAQDCINIIGAASGLGSGLGRLGA